MNQEDLKKYYRSVLQTSGMYITKEKNDTRSAVVTTTPLFLVSFCQKPNIFISNLLK